MAKSEDGHYELVLGNRQLVSGFFVLVILFAIFLTLGYILGRNSVVVTDQNQVAQEGESAARAAEMPLASNSGKPSAAALEPEALPAETTPAATTASRPPAPRETPKTEPAKPAPAPSATSAASAPPPSRTEEILNAKVRVITPRKGDMFVQVAAVGRAEAELMGEQLQKRGYRAFLSEVPNRDLFRVLVGPFQTAEKMGETKKKLESEGINSIIQRY